MSHLKASKLAVLTAVCLLGIGANRSAQAVVVNAGPSCAEWLKTRQAPYSIYEAYNEGFIVGTLNGMSTSSGVSLWINGRVSISNEQVYFWVDEYCRTNPLKYVPEALGSFADEVSQGDYGRAATRAWSPR
jgi:hypothetical protein